MIPHILIVDTDPGAARTTQALVTRIAAGATVACEPTPERGRSHLRRHPADLLIIDPSPYDLAADQLIQWLKAERPAARVIVLASAATSALRQRMEALGVDLFQEKHHPPSVLVQQLQAALDALLHSQPDEPA